MGRVFHRLGSRPKERKISAFVAVDTETQGVPDSTGKEHHYLIFGHAIFMRKNKAGTWEEVERLDFTDARDFWEWAEQWVVTKRPLYVIGHNLGFDLPVLQTFSVLDNLGWTLQSAIVTGPPVIVRYARGDYKIILLDSLNYYRMPLKTLGQWVGRTKRSVKTLGILTPTLKTYCRQDTRIVRDAIIRWSDLCEEARLGPIALTIAGQAFSAWRVSGGAKGVLFDADEESLELSRAGYFGARTEAFRLGEYTGRVHYLDVNSMYPWVQRSHYYPTEILGTYKTLTLKDAQDSVETRAMVADVTLDTDAPYYPVRYRGRLCFPVGEFRTILTTPELHLALHFGHVKTLHKVSIYRHAPLFREFVDRLHKLKARYRRRKDVAGEKIIKVLLNSLSGKIGQKGHKYEEIGRTELSDVRAWVEVNADSGAVDYFRSFGGVIQKRGGAVESTHSHPAISAHITAYARVSLLEHILTAGWENVLYVDTDSLLCTSEGRSRLEKRLHPTRLGALKVEGTYRGCEVRGVKDYRIGTQDRIKGVRKNAVLIEKNTYEQEQFTSLVGLVRTGRLQAPTVERVRKVLQRHYAKGNVERTGRVRPFKLSSQESVS